MQTKDSHEAKLEKTELWNSEAVLTQLCNQLSVQDLMSLAQTNTELALKIPKFFIQSTLMNITILNDLFKKLPNPPIQTLSLTEKDEAFEKEWNTNNSKKNGQNRNF